jgi:exo-1,4-beta-D-glucosaminidase
VIFRPRRPLRLRLLTATGVAAVIATTGVTADTDRSVPPRMAAVTIGASPGSSTTIPGFLIQSATKVASDGAVSRPGYPTTGWYPVPARSTVFAGLLANHRYPDPFHSTNMRSVATGDFSVPWWYRADLVLGNETGPHTLVDFSGVISAADVWVNGTRVATRAQVAGVYPDHELDLTALLHAGTNSIAFKIYPDRPDQNLTMGWIDWVQSPPDQNMGIVRDVVVRRSAGVALRNTHVRTALAMPSLNHADVTVKTDVRNDSAAAVRATVSGTVATNPVSRAVDLAAHQTRTLTIPVAIDNPKLWWPASMGGQPLYDVNLTASVAGASSDGAHERFGIRDVRSGRNASGARTYTINGRPLLIRGGGWSPDLFLRWNPGYVSDKLRYALDLGLNTIRLEGHLEPDEFFDLADRYGILTLPGWECCDKWEGQVNGGEPGEPWTSADYPVAAASMASQAARLRDHPSVISFLIGSDFAPDATIEKSYLDALNAADWPNPVIAAASDHSAPITGGSGMKMTGPYDWVPPNYWYDKNASGGGAWGFNSETSAGPALPTMDTLRRMMSAPELDTLWRDANAAQYHRSPSGTFGTLKIYDNALAGRYGAPAGLDDYVRKAQLAQYEAVRAQFEAYARDFTDPTTPSTGVVYWMLSSGWTSLHWQLFDYHLDQNGSYYGAKKANEPLHVQYSYDNRSVVVVNQRHAGSGDLGVRVDLYDPDGTARYSRTVTGLTAPGDGGRVTALTVPSLGNLSTTYLARLILTDGSGREIDRNVYWLSTRKDVIDWAHNDWYHAPTSSYADLSGLSGMAPASVSASAASTANGDGTMTTTVTLRTGTGGKTPAFFVDAHIVGANGVPVLPVRWRDNEVSLWPGESITLSATYRAVDLGGAAASVRVSGWNVPTRYVPA